MKIAINALQYKQNCSGIGVMIRDLFGPFTALSAKECNVIVSCDAPEFPHGPNTRVIQTPYNHGQTLHRVLFQAVSLGRHYGKNAILLVTDSKMPFFLPKSCVAVPLITDLALYRMPEVYKASRVLLWKLQYRYVKRRSNFFLTISQFSKDEIVKIFQIEPERVHIVPCACSENMKKVEDAQTLQHLRDKYNLPEQFVLFVGNTNPRKNLHRLMQAFDMAKEQGIPHQLVIAGEQGWKFNSAEALKGLKHGEDIRFIGFVPDEDMCALYSAASLFAFPTLYEGFGIPVLEAQSCGVPVLTSNCSSLPEVGGDAAVYVNPCDVKSIRNGMMRILNDSNYAEMLIQRGYENVKRFSWQKSAELLNEIIEREVQA